MVFIFSHSRFLCNKFKLLCPKRACCHSTVPFFFLLFPVCLWSYKPLRVAFCTNLPWTTHSLPWVLLRMLKVCCIQNLGLSSHPKVKRMTAAHGFNPGIWPSMLRCATLLLYKSVYRSQQCRHCQTMHTPGNQLHNQATSNAWTASSIRNSSTECFLFFLN